MITALVLLSLVAAAPQSGREPVLIEASLAAQNSQRAVHSAGNVTAAAYAVPSGLHLALSDGRGVEWSTPIALSTTIVGQPVPRVVVFEERVYVMWHDSVVVSPPSNLWLAIVDGATGAILSSGPLPLPMFVNGGFDLAVHRVGNAVRVHAACTGTNSLHLTTSNDGGATFAPHITKGNIAGGTAMCLAAVGDRVHALVGYGSQGSDEARYARSLDGGATFDPAPAAVVLGGAWPLRMAVKGDVVAIGAGRANLQNAQSRISTNGGDSWTPLGVAHWNFGNVEHYDMAMTKGGTTVMSYRRNQAATGIRTMLMRSTNGLVWTPEVQFVPSGDQPTQIFAMGDGGLLASWSDAGGTRRGAISYDEGVTFGAPFEVYSGSPFSGVAAWAWNDLYRNAIAVWYALTPPTTEFSASGFRPQTLTPVGFQSGPTAVGASFADFRGGNIAALLVSTSPGRLPIPGDGRNLGLAWTPVLSASIDLVGAGVFLTLLDPSGAGATPLLPASLAPGLTLHAVGIAFDTGTGAFGDISDVITIGL